MRQDEADALDKELGWAGRPIERSSVKAQPQQRTSGCSWVRLLEPVKGEPVTYFTGNSLADHDAQVRREALEEAAKTVCSICDGKWELFEPIPTYIKSTSHSSGGSYFHNYMIDRLPGPLCNAQAIRALIEKER